MLEFKSALSATERTETFELTFLTKDCRPDTLPIAFVRAWDDSMQRTPIVPHSHAPYIPLPPNGMVIGGVDVVLEELEELICSKPID